MDYQSKLSKAAEDIASSDLWKVEKSFDIIQEQPAKIEWIVEHHKLQTIKRARIQAGKFFALEVKHSFPKAIDPSSMIRSIGILLLVRSGREGMAFTSFQAATIPSAFSIDVATRVVIDGALSVFHESSRDLSNTHRWIGDAVRLEHSERMRDLHLANAPMYIRPTTPQASSGSDYDIPSDLS